MDRDRQGGADPLKDEAVALVAAVVADEPRAVWIVAGDGSIPHANPAASARGGDIPLPEADLRRALQSLKGGRTVTLTLFGGGRAMLSPLVWRGQNLAYVLREMPPEPLAARRLAELAHDLRAPLQALTLAATAAGEGEDLRDVARLALDQVQNVLARAEEAEGPPPRPFDLLRLCRDLLRLFQPLAAEHGTLLRFDPAPEMARAPLWLADGEEPLRLLLQNLLLNALHASKAAPVTLRLRRGSEEAAGDHDLVLEVEDRGGGLSEERLRLLLDGARARTEITPQTMGEIRRGPGHGYGLGIVADCLKRLEARINVQPVAEGGSCLRVSLRLAAGSAPSDLTEGASLRGLKLLVLEDEPMTRTLLLHCLRAAGAEAMGATTATEAAAVLCQRGAAFDMILLDITLPDGDGIALAREIRSGPLGAGLRIVGLTAHPAAALREAALAAGMDLLLTKPLGPSALCRALGGLQTASAAPSPEGGLDAAQIEELRAEMGSEATLAFMAKALAEAREVRAALGAGGNGASLRRMLHSAIGASGMTGLSRLESALRHAQKPLQEGHILDAATFAPLDRALCETEAAIEELRRSW